jgi:hypothetical protein
MNRERLELMCTLLAEVEQGTWEPSGLFDIAGQVLPLTERPGHRFDMVEWLDPVRPDCGFAACAIGHACLDTRFNAQGLFIGSDGAGQSPAPFFEDKGRLHRSWAAVGRFFDLTPVQEDYLFDGDKYPYDKRDPAAVRQRIEQALAKKEPHQ